MPRVTRSNSMQEDVVNVESSPEKDDKQDVKVAIAKVNKAQQHPESQLLMIVPDDLLENNKNVKVVKLRNPRTASENLYAFSHSDTRLYEINKFGEPKRSWFVDNSVQSDGALFVTTKIDARFLILPYLYKAKHTSPLDQLLVDEEYLDTHRLSSCVNSHDLEKIADLKQSGDFQAWKYNKEKTLSWLENKVTNLSKHLGATNHNVTHTAVSSNYIKTTASTIPETAFTRYAFGLISEYLSDELSSALEQHLVLPAVPKTMQNDGAKEPPTKRQKLSDGKHEPTEDYSKDQSPHSTKDKTQVTAKAKALANAAKGSKSISSFFAKK